MKTVPPLPPLPPNVVKDPDPYQTQFVASLRDQFAMHALSMLANSDLKWEPQNPDWRVAASNTAYLIADQMMERRKQ